MTADQVIQLGGEAITLGTIILTYLSTRKKVGNVSTMVDGTNEILRGRVEQLGQSIQEQGGKVPPSRPPSGPSKV